jgi:hypothetical protein
MLLKTTQLVLFQLYRGCGACVGVRQILHMLAKGHATREGNRSESLAGEGKPCGNFPQAKKDGFFREFRGVVTRECEFSWRIYTQIYSQYPTSQKPSFWEYKLNKINIK